jgi:hypothetical protein
VISSAPTFLLFPFWCLNAKGGEESIYLCCLSVFYSDLTCKTIIMYELVVSIWS